MRTPGGIELCPEWNAPLYKSCCPTRAEAWEKALVRARIPKRYRALTPQSLSRNSIPDYVAPQIGRVELWRQELSWHLQRGEGMILKGPPGTLKTSAAVSCLVKALFQGYGGLFLVSSCLLDDIFTLKTANPQEWVQFERRLKTTDLLIWDDLGEEHSEGWVLTKVSAIIAERYNNQRSTIVTTNLTTEELKGRYAGRIIDRLREISMIVTFKGASLRKPPGESS